jgi:hypothetical protein
MARPLAFYLNLKSVSRSSPSLIGCPRAILLAIRGCARRALKTTAQRDFFLNLDRRPHQLLQLLPSLMRRGQIGSGGTARGLSEEEDQRHTK